jgi:hypothetical protein
MGELNIKYGYFQAKPRFASLHAIAEPVFRSITAGKFVLKVIEITSQLFGKLTNIYRFRLSFHTYFHADLGIACRIPMYLKPISLWGLNQMEARKYWNALLKKAPTGADKDLDLLAVFRNVEIGYFRSFEYDWARGRLALRPKPLSQRKPGECKRCDIIYGRYNPNGTILTAVIGSD